MDRAVSDSSILTTECSRCVAEDAEQGLQFYGERYGGRKEYSGFGTGRRGRGDEEATVSSVVDSPDETGWRDLVKAVRKTWEEGKQAHAELLTRTQPQQAHQAQAPPHPVPIIVSPSRPQPGHVVPSDPIPQIVSAPSHHNPVSYNPPPMRTSPRRMGARAVVTPERDLVSEGSLGRWDHATPNERRKEAAVVRRPQREYQPVVAQRRTVSVPRRAASNPPPPVADSGQLQRRLQSLQKTVHSLQDDKVKLEAERVSLASENERYRRALESKDARLQKLKNVKHQITLLSNLNRKGAEIHSKRQQAISGLDREIKNLFTEWQDTRVNPKNRTTLTYRKPRAVWVC